MCFEGYDFFLTIRGVPSANPHYSRLFCNNNLYCALYTVLILLSHTHLFYQRGLCQKQSLRSFELTVSEILAPRGSCVLPDAFSVFIPALMISVEVQKTPKASEIEGISLVPSTMERSYAPYKE